MSVMGILSALTGTLVNAGGILLGSLLGMLLGKGLPERLSKAVMAGLGLCVVYVGISGVLEGHNTLVAILSMVFGALIGEGLDLDRQINRFGQWIERKLNSRGGHTPVAEGFVTSCLLFCVGAMAIVGSLNSGLLGDHTMLYTKACLDSVSAVVFSSTLGIGVALSAGVILVEQGGIALLAHLVAPFLGDAVVAEMTCVGSLLIIALGLNMLGITKIKVMNYVPAVLLPILLCPLYSAVAGWIAAL